jgi:glycosyltransferase involved in cell wall biosynthesis
VVKHDQTGFVCAQPADWIDALEALAADPALQRKLGQAAREELETRWHGSDGAHIISPEILKWVEA